MHDGESRHWGSRDWAELPADIVAQITHVRFWDYQFVRGQEVRAFLYWYHENPDKQHLNESAIDWILQKEKGGAALLTRKPASGGPSATWYIRTGNHVTLAEIFNWGCNLCSCHFLYGLYLRQPLFLTKRHHSNSKSPNSQLRKNAKNLHHQETGKRGLPDAPWRGP